jgi:hypothetical protein
MSHQDTLYSLLGLYRNALEAKRYSLTARLLPKACMPILNALVNITGQITGR